MTCPLKTDPEQRPLLGLAEAGELAGLFEVLASATRVRLLHALMTMDDPCMSDLAAAVEMKAQAVSNQLRKLVDLGVLDTCRHGNHIHYRIVEPCVTNLLHQGLCINEDQVLRKVGYS
jgi:ArsR family transcriptional regulator, lead/cadmium/zinc/bismuth-responsive transcriptional repressor